MKNIIELARQSGFFISTEMREVYGMERFERFANAVIKAHTEELIAGAGEPAAKFNWNAGKFEWLTKYNYQLHHDKPLYTATQVAAAVAKERAEYQASMDHQNAMARQRKERIATLESVLKVAQSDAEDALLRKLGLDPASYRTEGGEVNHLKVKAAIRNPKEYPLLCQHEWATASASLGGQICKHCGRMK